MHLCPPNETTPAQETTRSQATGFVMESLSLNMGVGLGAGNGRKRGSLNSFVFWEAVMWTDK